MNALREIYDFITGGSIAAPVGLACAITAAFVLHVWRAEIFCAIVALAFVASTLEKVA
ncbi:MAG: hypothetical protein M3R51_08245 [Candidatus Eremiobacteraeota bacterium]|nr:hypothetical protein [Candidatus Eremiobacteraeota bacterium]